MTTQLLADALPELPKAIFWARNIDGRLELRAGEKPPNRACGYASPWAAMYDGPSVRDYAIQALAEHDATSAAPDAPAPVQPPANGDAELPPTGHPLQKLGARLGELLDEDHWAECERLLLEGWARDEIDRKTGRHWRENSDLEVWFPMTAEELERLRAENVQLRHNP